MPIPHPRKTTSFQQLAVKLVDQLKWLYCHDYIGDTSKEHRTIQVSNHSNDFMGRHLTTNNQCQCGGDQQIATKQLFMKVVELEKVIENLEQQNKPSVHFTPIKQKEQQPSFLEDFQNKVKHIEYQFRKPQYSMQAVVQHQQKYFNELLVSADQLIFLALSQFAELGANKIHFATYSKTMQELDQVFQTSDQEVAQQLRVLQLSIEQDIKKLLLENQLLLTAAKIPQNQRVDTTDICIAMNRIQFLEMRQTELHAENSDLHNQVTSFQSQMHAQQVNIADLEQTRSYENELHQNTINKIHELEGIIQIQNDKLRELVNINEELRMLIQEERLAMSNEIAQLQEEIKQEKRQQERKQQLLKSKLLVLVGSFTAADRELAQQWNASEVGKQPNLSIDCLIQSLQDFAIYLSKITAAKWSTPQTPAARHNKSSSRKQAENASARTRSVSYENVVKGQNNQSSVMLNRTVKNDSQSSRNQYKTADSIFVTQQKIEAIPRQQNIQNYLIPDFPKQQMSPLSRPETVQSQSISNYMIKNQNQNSDDEQPRSGCEIPERVSINSIIRNFKREKKSFNKNYHQIKQRIVDQELKDENKFMIDGLGENIHHKSEGQSVDTE